MKHETFGMLHSRGLWISELLMNEVLGSEGLAGFSSSRAGSIARRGPRPDLLLGRTRGIAKEFVRQ